MSFSFLSLKRRKDTPPPECEPHHSNLSRSSVSTTSRSAPRTVVPSHDAVAQRSTSTSDVINNPLGITQLHDSASAQVDIVFVHGLTGKSHTTWLHKATNTHWPSQLLHKDIDNIRILAFGYDADVASFWGGASDNRLAEHAENLVGQLTGLREETDTENRKIVFVAHSLGGLLVEKALCVSESHSEEHLRPIELHTSGIVFLGTPHRGSDVTDFPHAVARILQMGGKRINSDILGVLKRESEVLQDVEDWFYKWLRRRTETGNKGGPISITSFREELALPGGIVVVKRDSARIEGYHNQSIHANHEDITKFPPSGYDGHQGYVEVRRAIARCVKRLRKVQSVVPTTSDLDEANLKQACLQSLFFYQQRTRHDTIYSAMQGTFDWIWKHDSFCSWMQEARGIFWIAGNPGSGKSTLTKHIFWHPKFRDHVRQSVGPRRLVVAGHFFDHKTEGLGRSIEGLYRSIIWQFLQQEPRLFSHILKLFSELQSYQEAVSWTRHDLEQIFGAMVTLTQSEDGDAISQELYYCIFVDALDEFEGQDHRIATFLEEIMSSANSHIMVCASSRPRTDFIHQFKMYRQLSMHLETKPDISLYAFKSCPELSSHSLPEYRELVNTIIDKSDGIFLWVRLVCDRLRMGSRKGETAKALKMAISDLPTDLFELYQRMFDDIEEEDRDEAHELFAIVSAASRVLTLSELRCVIASNTTPERCRPSSFIRREINKRNDAEEIRLQNRIRGICGGLIETRPSAEDMVVVPIHATIRTFLRQSSLSTGDILADNILSYGHSILLNATTNYLQTLSTADLPFNRTKQQFRSDQGMILFQDTKVKSADGQPLPSSQWSMTTAGGQTEQRSFLDWLSAYTLLGYSTEMWAFHARSINISSRARMIEYVDRIGAHTFQIWREIFWEFVKRASEVDLVPDDMPCDVLEHAFACNCVIYVKARFYFGNMVDVEHPKRLLLSAIRSGSLELCELLLKSFEKHHFVEEDTPDPFLHFAIDFSHPELIPTLVAFGFNLAEPVGYTLRHKRWSHAPLMSIRTRFVRCSPLDLAVLLHHNDIVRQLLKLLSSPQNAETPEPNLGRIIGHDHTVRPTNTRGIRLLLEHGITPDIDPAQGFHPSFTPIGHSIEQGNYRLFSDLLRHGANVDYSHNGLSLLSFAILTHRKRSFDTVRRLLSEGAQPDSNAFTAALDYRLEILEDLLMHSHLSVDSLFDEKQTLLHQAITMGNISTIQSLLSRHHANPNIPNSDSDYPIHTAFLWPEHKAIEIITELCYSGRQSVNLHVMDSRGRTPFELALHTGCSKIITMLAEAGLRLNPTFIESCIASLSLYGANSSSSNPDQDIPRIDVLLERPPPRKLYAHESSTAARVDMWISDVDDRLTERRVAELFQINTHGLTANTKSNTTSLVFITYLESALELASGSKRTIPSPHDTILLRSLATILGVETIHEEDLNMPNDDFISEHGHSPVEFPACVGLEDIDLLCDDDWRIELEMNLGIQLDNGSSRMHGAEDEGKARRAFISEPWGDCWED